MSVSPATDLDLAVCNIAGLGTRPAPTRLRLSRAMCRLPWRIHVSPLLAGHSSRKEELGF